MKCFIAMDYGNNVLSIDKITQPWKATNLIIIQGQRLMK
jgi:hypothetical protein